MGSGGVVGETALLDISSNILFVERTADGEEAMDIDREEMSKVEAAAIAEEEGYLLR